MSKRVLIAGLTLASFLPTTTASCDLPEIKAAQRLRVLIAKPGREYIAVPPHAPGENAGPASGVEGELLEAFARLNGLKLDIVEVPGWDELVPGLLAGRGDLIAGNFTDTERRRDHIDFTAQVIPTRLIVVTRKPKAPIRTIAELRRERVGTIRGSSMAEALVAAGISKSNLDDSVPQGGNITERLKDGAFTAAVEELAVAMQAARRDSDLRLGMFLGPPGSLAWGVRKQDAQLRSALDDYIANARRTATWSRLVVKYYGQPALEILRGARGE